MKILIIEDERKVASFIKRGLEENEHEADIAYNGSSGMEMAFNNPYELVILDVKLPDQSGLSVCGKIKINKSIPILMLTALGAVEDKVTGLDAGADDYLLKPFEFNELLARIRALSRRNNLFTYEQNILKIADLQIDTKAKSVTRGKQKIELTAKEYYLLEYLIKNQGQVVSRAEIAENVWNLKFDTGTNMIDVYINYLRKKVDKEFSPKLIHTLIGIGYVLKTEV